MEKLIIFVLVHLKLVIDNYLYRYVDCNRTREIVMPEDFELKRPYSAMAIANTFLDMAWGEHKNIDPLKMQKLVYFAHGWFLAYKGRPLIYDQVQAWKSGPVIPSLYHEFKRYGYHPIGKHGEEPAEDDPIPKVKDSEILEFLRNVWNVYSKYDALKLSSISHHRRGPWAKCKEEYDNERHIVIDNDKIKEYFQSIAPQS